MNARHDSFRRVLASIRAARAALAKRDLPDAIHHTCVAKGALSFSLGLFATETRADATCRLRRAVARLELALEDAVRPPPPVLPSDLVLDVVAGLTVLRTMDGVDVDDDQILDRARNIVSGLIGNYDIRERTELPTFPQHENANGRADNGASGAAGAEAGRVGKS